MPLDEEFAAIADLLLDLGRDLRMRTTLTAGDPNLTQTQGTVMRFVHRNEGCTPSEVASGTGLQRANVSTALRELRELGYLETSPHEGDARGIRIRTTPLADENLERLRRSWVELLEAAWASSPGERDAGELHTARSVLERLAANLSGPVRP